MGHKEFDLRTKRMKPAGIVWITKKHEFKRKGASSP